MWSIIEIIAVLVECFLAISFNVGYFKMKDDKFIRLKILGGTVILSLWDYFGTLIAKNEFFSMIGFTMILLIFSSLFLKKSYFEKFIIAVISCTLFYLINLPVIYVISYIFRQPVRDVSKRSRTNNYSFFDENILFCNNADNRLFQTKTSICF